MLCLLGSKTKGVLSLVKQRQIFFESYAKVFETFQILQLKRLPPCIVYIQYKKNLWIVWQAFCYQVSCCNFSCHLSRIHSITANRQAGNVISRSGCFFFFLPFLRGVLLDVSKLLCTHNCGQVSYKFLNVRYFLGWELLLGYSKN